MPWKKQDGDARAVQGRTAIYLSGQLSHDNRGNIVGLSDRQTQMRQAWADVEKCSLNTVAPCIRVLMGRAQAVGKSSYFSRRI
jgi:hypothetical protein